MKKVTVKRAGGPFELNDERIPEPGSGYVRVKVQASGVCHSDSLTKEGVLPGIAYPRSPGHEIDGGIDAPGRPRTRRSAGRATGRPAARSSHGGPPAQRRRLRRVIASSAEVVSPRSARSQAGTPSGRR